MNLYANTYILHTYINTNIPKLSNQTQYHIHTKYALPSSRVYTYTKTKTSNGSGSGTGSRSGSGSGTNTGTH